LYVVGYLKQRTIKSMRILSFVMLFLFFSSCGKTEKKEKINLLFIWTDQQRFDTMKAYGNDKIKTPNLDKLAGRSIVFKRAYVTQPVCTPSRSTIMTGLYPHTSGCIENNIPLKEGIKTVPELINDPEYKSAYMGKWHLGNEVFVQQGFDEWYAIEDGYYKHYSINRDRDVKSAYHNWLIEKGVKPDVTNGRFSRGLASKLPIEQGKPKFLEEKAIEFMEKNRDNPFVLYVNYLEPHAPFTSTLNGFHNIEDLIIPDDGVEFDSLTYRNMLRSFSKDKLNPEKQAEFVQRYWGLVSKVDMSVGKIMDKLKELGLDDNTLVVFTSDHGEMLGSHSLKSKRYAYDESSRVPLMVKLPGSQTQRIVEEPVGHIDVVPTILDYMGYETDEPLQGKSLVDVLNGGELKDNYVYFEMAPLIGILKPKMVDDDIVSRMQLSKDEINEIFYAHYRAVVSPDGWKMVVSDKDKNQLYNLSEDPQEYDNRYYSGRHADVISRLSEKLTLWQKETGDQLKLRF
jgi:arylsulfatase A-like enzyme